MKTLLLALVLTASTQMAQASDLPPLKTVDYVDIERYAGLWHQIAFYPTRFQKNCMIDTTATYSLRGDGKVGVVNQCTKNNGKRNEISGTARIVDAKTQAKLKVKFFWFAPAGNYWVIDLGKDYEYAVVGEPKRKFLWILSRTPTLASDVYEGILRRAEAQGYDRNRIQITGTVSAQK